jgi:peptidyl-prolyl cis-trans isomerase C
MLSTKKTQIILNIFLWLFICGCGHKDSKNDSRVLAKINNYELRVSDLKEAADPALLKRYASYSPANGKEQLLDILISKEVLLQEAQKLNLDKEKSFMKEIEGYWEQALLKSLINRKIKELSANITVTDEEIANEYNRLQQKVLAELVIFADKAPAQQLSKAGTNFDVVKQALKGQIVLEVPADWYTSRDLPLPIESYLFVMKPGELSPAIEYNNGWVVLRVLNAEARSIGPFQELKEQIREDILRAKREDLLESWSADLREKASVKINKGLLKEIELK